MPFTNLNKKLSSRRLYSSPPRKSRKKFWMRLLIILLILFVAIYFPLRGIYSSGRALVASSRAVAAAAKQDNLDDIRKNLQDMRKANDSLNTNLNFLIWVQVIPYFGGFYSDIRHFSKAAHHELNAASTIADSLDPFKNELGFTGTPKPGQDKVAQMVKVLDKVIPQLDKVQPELKKAAEEVSGIDVNKYPENYGNRRVRSLVDTAKNFIIGADYAVSEARPALEVAPSALGEPSAKNYLIIFQNDKELRATGGFMTAYATLKLDKGRVSSSGSDDIYRLDEKLLGVCVNQVCPLRPPAPLVKYLPEATGKPRTVWAMRDSNLSPDVPTSLKEFERMYQLLGEGMPWDGIILIDTYVVEELIKITGPVEVFGTKYSAENDNRCNCPNVIYELENYAQVIEKGQTDRKAILGTLMQQILARALGSTTEKMPEFINSGVKLANSKHVMLFMHDQKTHTALSKLNWTGQLQESEGDYLHVNDSNFAGGKSNLYVEEEVTLEIDTKNVDKVKSKLSIKYNNPAKYKAWLNQRNRDYLRIYVPKGSKLTNSKGSDVAVTTIEDELGKTVFEAFLEIRPENSRTITFEYELPKGASGKEYPILIQKQPGTKDHKYTIKVNGKTKEEFKLSSDKKLNLSI
jgi:hypothetical protein